MAQNLQNHNFQTIVQDTQLHTQELENNNSMTEENLQMKKKKSKKALKQ